MVTVRCPTPVPITSTIALRHWLRTCSKSWAVLGISDSSWRAWTNLNMKSALNSWHWLFLAQPEPFPDTRISAVPAEWFLKSRGYDRQLPKIVFDDYIRCFTRKTIVGSCRHYRANATID